MTPKELLYVEDALAQGKQIQTVCSNFTSQVQDAELKTFISGLANKHQDCFGKFYGLLNK